MPFEIINFFFFSPNFVFDKFKAIKNIIDCIWSLNKNFVFNVSTSNMSRFLSKQQCMQLTGFHFMFLHILAEITKSNFCAFICNIELLQAFTANLLFLLRKG